MHGLVPHRVIRGVLLKGDTDLFAVAYVGILLCVCVYADV